MADDIFATSPAETPLNTAEGNDARTEMQKGTAAIVEQVSATPKSRPSEQNTGNSAGSQKKDEDEDEKEQKTEELKQKTEEIPPAQKFFKEFFKTESPFEIVQNIIHKRTTAVHAFEIKTGKIAPDEQKAA